MANKDEIANAVKVIKDVAGDPTMGPIKELIDLLNTSIAPVVEAKDSGADDKEIRVTTVKETR